MFNQDAPAKCCSYCGGRDHDFEECPKRKADAEREHETAGKDLIDDAEKEEAARVAEPAAAAKPGFAAEIRPLRSFASLCEDSYPL